MTAGPELHVQLIGMDARDEAAFRIIFSSKNYRFVFDAIEPALLVIDHDNPDAQRLWELARRDYPKARSLVLSRQVVAQGDGHLRKSFKPDELYAMALRLCGHAVVAPVPKKMPETGAIKPLAFTEQSGLPGERETHYDPAMYLQQYLHEAAAMARDKQGCVLIQGLPRDVLFCGIKGTVHTELSDHTLRPLCRVPIQTGLVSLRLVEPSAEVEMYPRMPTEVFLWKAAMWTARGRLPVGCNPDHMAKLSRWPNLTRLTEIPHALRLSAMWGAQAISPNQMVKQLGIPAENVFDFFSACHAQGLMNLLGEAVGRAASAPASQPHKNRPMLSWIMNKLRTL